MLAEKILFCSYFTRQKKQRPGSFCLACIGKSVGNCFSSQGEADVCESTGDGSIHADRLFPSEHLFFQQDTEFSNKRRLAQEIVCLSLAANRKEEYFSLF